MTLRKPCQGGFKLKILRIEKGEKRGLGSFFWRSFIGKLLIGSNMHFVFGLGWFGGQSRGRFLLIWIRLLELTDDDNGERPLFLKSSTVARFFFD